MKHREGIYYFESGEYEYATYSNGSNHGKAYEFDNNGVVIIRIYEFGFEKLPHYVYNCVGNE